MGKFNSEAIESLKTTKQFLAEKGLLGVKNELTFSVKNMFKRVSRISEARPSYKTELYEELNCNIISKCSDLRRRYI